jgi:hypothetical protein
MESEWMGSVSEDFKAKGQERFGAVAESLRGAADSVGAKIADAGNEAFEHLRKAGADATEAARKEIGG